MYQESDCGIFTYKSGLENILSFRSRIIDAMWGGLPSILTGGNELAETVASNEAGIAVRPDDPDDLVEAMEFMLENESSRRRMAANTRNLASEFEWNRVVQPLHEFCRRPSFAEDKGNPAIMRSLHRSLRAESELVLQNREFAERTLQILKDESPVSLVYRAKRYFKGLYGLR
jgi:hypothetical protein